MLKVFCYFNLHRKCFSIKALEGPNKGRVVAHINGSVALTMNSPLSASFTTAQPSPTTRTSMTASSTCTANIRSRQVVLWH